jgi:hypothetical protein
VVPVGQPEQAVSEIDLIAQLSEADIARMRAKPTQQRYADYDASLRPHLLALQLSPKDVFKQNAMPLAAYLALRHRRHVHPRSEIYRLPAAGRLTMFSRLSSPWMRISLG